MSHYCTECRCYHPRDMDITGACFRAEGWYEMHHDETDPSDYAWERWAREEIGKRPRPVFRVHHSCGHATFENNNHRLEWCRDCEERRANERYDGLR